MKPRYLDYLLFTATIVVLILSHFRFVRLEHEIEQLKERPILQPTFVLSNDVTYQIVALRGAFTNGYDMFRIGQNPWRWSSETNSKGGRRYP